MKTHTECALALAVVRKSAGDVYRRRILSQRYLTPNRPASGASGTLRRFLDARLAPWAAQNLPVGKLLSSPVTFRHESGSFCGRSNGH